MKTTTAAPAMAEITRQLTEAEASVAALRDEEARLPGEITAAAVRGDVEAVTRLNVRRLALPTELPALEERVLELRVAETEAEIAETDAQVPDLAAQVRELERERAILDRRLKEIGDRYGWLLVHSADLLNRELRQRVADLERFRGGRATT